jgi:hypothetical protein
MENRDSTVGIATGCGMDDRGVGVRVLVGARIFISPCRPDLIWDPPSLLSNGYRELFLLGQSGRGVKIQLVPRSRKRGSIRLHGVVLNYINTGTTLPLLLQEWKDEWMVRAQTSTHRFCRRERKVIRKIACGALLWDKSYFSVLFHFGFEVIQVKYVQTKM